MTEHDQGIALSKSDVAILNHLQNDWSVPRQKMADDLGMSLSTLRRRIRELEAIGILKAPAALINPRKAGLSVCAFISINMIAHEPETRRSFEEWVHGEGEIVECYAVTGQHDYTLIVRTKNVAAFERYLMDRLLNHPSVASALSQIALREHKYTVALPLYATRES